MSRFSRDDAEFPPLSATPATLPTTTAATTAATVSAATVPRSVYAPLSLVPLVTQSVSRARNVHKAYLRERFNRQNRKMRSKVCVQAPVVRVKQSNVERIAVKDEVDARVVAMLSRPIAYYERTNNPFTLLKHGPCFASEKQCDSEAEDVSRGSPKLRSPKSSRQLRDWERAKTKALRKCRAIPEVYPFVHIYCTPQDVSPLPLPSPLPPSVAEESDGVEEEGSSPPSGGDDSSGVMPPHSPTSVSSPTGDSPSLDEALANVNDLFDSMKKYSTSSSEHIEYLELERSKLIAEIKASYGTTPPPPTPPPTPPPRGEGIPLSPVTPSMGSYLGGGGVGEKIILGEKESDHFVNPNWSSNKASTVRKSLDKEFDKSEAQKPRSKFRLHRPDTPDPKTCPDRVPVEYFFVEGDPDERRNIPPFHLENQIFDYAADAIFKIRSFVRLNLLNVRVVRPRPIPAKDLEKFVANGYKLPKQEKDQRLEYHFRCSNGYRKSQVGNSGVGKKRKSVEMLDELGGLDAGQPKKIRKGGGLQKYIDEHAKEMGYAVTKEVKTKDSCCTMQISMRLCKDPKKPDQFMKYVVTMKGHTDHDNGCMGPTDLLYMYNAMHNLFVFDSEVEAICSHMRVYNNAKRVSRFMEQFGLMLDSRKVRKIYNDALQNKGSLESRIDVLVKEFQSLQTTEEDRAKTTFHVNYNITDKEVQFIFIQDARHYRTGLEYGDMIFIDGTYKTNLSGYTLYVITSMSGPMVGAPIAHIYVKDDSYLSLQEALVFMLSRNIHLYETCKVVMSDRQASLNKVISEVFSKDTVNLFCRWHILKNMYEHLPKSGKVWETQSDKSKVKTDLNASEARTLCQQLTYCHTRAQYEQITAELQKYKDFWKYYSQKGGLKDCEENWIPMYRHGAKFPCLCSHTNNLCEGHNSALKRCYLLLPGLYITESIRRLLTSFTADFLTLEKYLFRKLAPKTLQHWLYNILSTVTFKRVIDNIFVHFRAFTRNEQSYTVQCVEEDSGIDDDEESESGRGLSIYSVKQAEKEKTYTVTFSSRCYILKCNCYFSGNMLLPCAHSFAVLKYLGLQLTPAYIHRRWLRSTLQSVLYNTAQHHEPTVKFVESDFDFMKLSEHEIDLEVLTNDEAVVLEDEFEIYDFENFEKMPEPYPSLKDIGLTYDDDDDDETDDDETRPRSSTPPPRSPVLKLYQETPRTPHPTVLAGVTTPGSGRMVVKGLSRTPVGKLPYQQIRTAPSPVVHEIKSPPLSPETCKILPSVNMSCDSGESILSAGFSRLEWEDLSPDCDNEVKELKIKSHFDSISECLYKCPVSTVNSFMSIVVNMFNLTCRQTVLSGKGSLSGVNIRGKDEAPKRGRPKGAVTKHTTGTSKLGAFPVAKRKNKKKSNSKLKSVAENNEEGQFGSQMLDSSLKSEEEFQPVMPIVSDSVSGPALDIPSAVSVSLFCNAEPIAAESPSITLSQSSKSTSVESATKYPLSAIRSDSVEQADLLPSVSSSSGKLPFASSSSSSIPSDDAITISDEGVRSPSPPISDHPCYKLLKEKLAPKEVIPISNYPGRQFYPSQTEIDLALSGNTVAQFVDKKLSENLDSYPRVSALVAQHRGNADKDPLSSDFEICRTRLDILPKTENEKAKLKTKTDWYSSASVDSAMFEDNILNAYFVLLRTTAERKFPGILIQDQGKPFELKRAKEGQKFLQILNLGDMHYVLISNIGCGPGEVNLYDSLASEELGFELKLYIAAVCIDLEGTIVVYRRAVQQQGSQSNCNDGNLCGVFCCSTATDIIINNNSPQIHDETKMRDFILNAVFNSDSSEIEGAFPCLDEVSHVNFKIRICDEKRYTISVSCQCKLPILRDSSDLPANKLIMLESSFQFGCLEFKSIDLSRHAKCKGCNSIFHLGCKNLNVDVREFFCGCIGTPACDWSKDKHFHKLILEELGKIHEDGMLSDISTECFIQMAKTINPSILIQSTLQGRSQTGLNSVTVSKSVRDEIKKQEFIQVLHQETPIKHWLLVTSIGAMDDFSVSVYDSLHSNILEMTSLHKFQISQILCSFFQEKRIIDKGRSIKYHKRPCAQQLPKSLDCGYYALAFATDILFGFNASNANYNIPLLHSWWKDCLVNGKLTRCPQVTNSEDNISTNFADSYVPTNFIQLMCRCRLAYMTELDKRDFPSGFNHLRVNVCKSVINTNVIAPYIQCHACYKNCHQNCIAVRCEKCKCKTCRSGHCKHIDKFCGTCSEITCCFGTADKPATPEDKPGIIPMRVVATLISPPVQPEEAKSPPVTKLSRRKPLFENKPFQKPSPILEQPLVVDALRTKLSNLLIKKERISDESDCKSEPFLIKSFYPSKKSQSPVTQVTDVSKDQFYFGKKVASRDEYFKIKGEMETELAEIIKKSKNPTDKKYALYDYRNLPKETRLHIAMKNTVFRLNYEYHNGINIKLSKTRNKYSDSGFVGILNYDTYYGSRTRSRST
jgi:hypothetical protein